jgi:hypothetical protein
MKKAKLFNAPPLSFVGTTYIYHDHEIGIETRHIAFEMHEKMLDKERGFHDGTIFKVLERGFHDGTIFKVPWSFYFFIKGAREVNINFMKITNIYITLKKADSESHSRSQLMKLILQEVMEIIIEDHGVDNTNQSIQDVIEEVKYLQFLRSHVIISFGKDIVQVVTETRSVLYEMAST